ncbi:serine/threonine-protein phosphatase 6 regulatory ankyrin repeat subunit A-like isoform X2 [Haliotis rufescens]|uniref:serine/threonine-protein phosphatase 6 regulatory ankyrin repeat subunit A-like isoform X2 n=1 Tax=Haliotis rufescens TaxID=6454 RepID=UPI00201ECA94|nr:serine/threonine-protein phosphatase 6 regulatory ankyrin repeat subunit A-like isoform X2 [Haliotis rufescens]
MDAPRAVLVLYQTLLIVTHGQDSCTWGKYGENCSKDCPSNCLVNPERNIRHCHKVTGKCSEGCVPGWFEDLCDQACSKNCLRNICNRQNGICTFGCSGDNRGDYCNIGQDASTKGPIDSTTNGPIDTTTTQPTNLAAILIPVFIVIIVVAIILAVVVLRLNRRRGRSDNSPAERLRLIDLQPEAGQCTSPRDEEIQEMSHSDGDKLPKDLLYQMKDIKDLFIETESFNLVKEKLKTFGHVTISGAPGSGKTSMALMLGAEYRKQGYELVLVEDVGTVQLSDCLGQGKGVCAIFDDIFQKGGFLDVHRLRQVLYELHGHLEQWRTKLETRYHSLQQTRGAEQRRTDHPNLYLIFTTDSNNLECAMSKLEGHIFFQNSSVVDLTKSKKLEEKKAIWLIHKRHYKCETDVDVSTIIAYEETVGFPLACKLFSTHVPFQGLKETFFERSLFYLQRDLHKHTSQLDDQSLKLLLKSMCDGEVKIRQQETESDAHLKRVLTLVSLFHPLIHDTCMSVLLKTKPELVLHNCSIKFICEHVHGQQHNAAHVEQNAIHFSDAYSDTIAARLAEAVVAGTFSRYIMHPMWKRKDIEDKVYQMLKDVGTMSSDSMHSVLHFACFSGNNDIIERFLPHCDINRRAVNGWTPAMFAVTGGQIDTLKLLVKHQADITLRDTVNKDLFHLACEYGDMSMVKCVETVMMKGTDWHINCRGMNDMTPVMCAAFSGKNDLLDYLVKKKTSDLTLRDRNNNTVLHLACIYANESIVNSLLPLTDRDCQGENGMTPIMCALLSGRRDIFNLLMSHNSDTSLTDDDNNSLLHLACLLDDVPNTLLTKIDWDVQGNHSWTPAMKAAVNGAAHAFDLLVKAKADLYPKDDNKNNILHLACHGGHVSIVKYVLSMFDINACGNNGWTPVMYAAGNGLKDVFDLLVSKEADSSLKDDYSNSVFHLASLGGNISIVEDLLPTSDINSRGDHGRTAIMNAAWTGHSHIFKFLVSQDIDLKLTDDNNDTVLHFACEGGDAAIVEHLLTRVDLNTRGRNGWTPVMVAARFGKLDPFNLLVSKQVDIRLTDDNNNNILHLACQGGNRFIIKHLLPLFDINSRGQDGRTAVMYAAVNGLRSVFDLLVSNKADVSLKDDYNNSVFHLACLGGNSSIVEQLFPNVDISSVDDNGRTAIMKAAYARQKSVFNFLVSKNSDLKVIDDYRDNVLHFACKGGDKTIVQCILQRLDINTRGRNGCTPVMIAARFGNRHLFNLLVSKEVDLTMTDDHGNDILHLACRGGNRLIIEHLLPLFDLNSRGQDGRTAVMYAAVNGRRRAFDPLVSNGADISLKDDYNNSVFNLACTGGNMYIVEYLLPKNEINSRGHVERTAIMEVALAGKRHVFDFLVSKEADLKLIDAYTDTVLHCACQGGNTAIVEYLLKILDINEKGQNGLTPVMHAARAGQKDVFSLLVSQQDELNLLDHTRNNLLHLACQGGNRFIIKYLLPLFDVNGPGEDGWTPIMMAAVSGKMDAYDLLASNGGIPSLTTPQNDNVLHAACQGGNKAIVRKVIDIFDINTRGRNGSTPLMRAVIGGHISVLKFLMSRSADHTLVDNDGLTLLHLACKYGHLDVVKHISDRFDINTKDKAGLTCIMTSVLYGKVAVFEDLQSRNADLSLVDNEGDDALNLALKVDCKQIIEKLSSGRESERNVTPWNALMKAEMRSDVYHLNKNRKVSLRL